MRLPVGIEKLGIYPCSLALPMSSLCEARGREIADIRDVMMIDERSLNPLWEDPVTMAVNAANLILSDEDRQKIELLIVASESAVDYEKPLSTWLQRYCGIQANCRNFEIKHACYGGTAGLQMASTWLTSGLARGAKALLVTTDQSRTHIGQPWEFVLGGGAAAVLLSNEPRILKLELEQSGYWTNEVSDLFRPTGSTETGNSETSLVSYMDGLEGAFEHFLSRVPEARDYDGYFQRHLYHMPFGGIAWRAHRTLLRQRSPISNKEAWANFERKSLASLRYARRMGATYSSSLFVGLAGLICSAPDLAAGERISVFSYGSGSCAEFYSARIGQDLRVAAEGIRLAEKLDARRIVSVPEYESIETQRTQMVDRQDFEVPLNLPEGWYERFYKGKHFLTFRGAANYYRQYEWS